MGSSKYSRPPLIFCATFMEKYPLINKEQKNGKPWIKTLNKHFAIYYNGKEVKKRYAYCLTFIK